MPGAGGDDDGDEDDEQANGDDDGDGELPPPFEKTTIGVYDPARASFLLKNTQAQGAPDHTIEYGLGQWQPLVGDWDGDGIDTIGTYDSTSHATDGIFLLKNALAQGAPDHTIQYGNKAHIPVVGDWDGDGKDTIGVFDVLTNPGQGRFLLRNTLTPGAPDIEIPWGMTGDIPVIGHWDDPVNAQVGIYRPSTAEYYLRKKDGGLIQFTSGHFSYKPLIGDWDANGLSDIGFYDPAQAMFILLYADKRIDIVYGAATYVPLVGVWTK
jgi:hypothetical protein